MADLDQSADTWLATQGRGTPAPDSREGVEDLELQRLRAQVHGRLFGSDAAEPVTIGRYQVREYLGSGGMGVVYAAEDPQLDRRVAIKVLRSDSLGERARHRLAREAKALARLSHPNVVHVYEVGGTDDRMFVAMEFIDGGTLTEWLHETPRHYSEILTHFLDAGLGLSAAHEAGLIHRDFKPDNVLLDQTGRPKVVDFGLVLTTGDPVEPSLGTTRPDREASLTATGTLMGTPAYMAPEQHRGGAVDARTDVFAFCVALYEALFGMRPFAGQTYAALAEAVVAGRLESIPAAGRAVPKHVRAAILRGLKAEPEDRFQSMPDLLDALRVRPAPPLWARVTAVVFGVTLMGLGWVAAGDGGAESAAPAAVCEAASGKLAGVWDEDRRDAIGEAFAATGQSFAAGAFERLEGSLDEYSGTWAEVWSDACQDALGSDPDAAEDGMRQMRCLDLRLTELRQLSDLFVDADADLVARAVDAAAAMTGPDECVDARLAIATDPVSDDAARLEQQFARARALAAAGRLEEAASIAAAVMAEARSRDLPMIAARAGLLEVRASPRLATIARVKRLHRVVAVARRAKDIRTETEAWIAMLDAASRDDADATTFELASGWADLAQALLDERPDPRLAVDLHLAMAQLSRRRDDDDGTREQLAKTRDIIAARAKFKESPHPRTAARIGKLEVELGQADAAEQHFRDAAESLGERLGVHHPEAIAARVQLAEVTSDDHEAVELASEAFAASIAGGRSDRKRYAAATTAMALLGRLNARCIDASDEAACARLPAFHGVVEAALRDAGTEAGTAQKIAGDAKKTVHRAARWRHQPPRPGGPESPKFPAFEIEPGVAIEFTDGDFTLVVASDDGQRVTMTAPMTPKPPSRHPQASQSPPPPPAPPTP